MPRWRPIELAFLALLAVVMIAQSVKVASRVAHDGSTAFARWQSQLRQIEDGVDISEAHHFPNPPVMAVLLEPLAKLPPVPAALTWFYLKAALAALALWQVVRIVNSPDTWEEQAHPQRNALWILIVACGLKPILDDLSHGNVNIVILYLLVTALTAYRARRDLLAG